MPNDINYAEKFESQLQQVYARDLISSGMTTQEVRWDGAKTIKVPKAVVSGYKDHGRGGGFNTGTVDLDWDSYTLTHDRDIEFFVDSMDVEESNQAVSAGQITNRFLQKQAIPETDAYRFSKLYADFVAHGGSVDTTTLTTDNIMSIFDTAMEAMDEAEVPEEGRILYVTPTVDTLLKNAKEITRMIQNGTSAVNRITRSIDDVTLVKVPSARFKSAYNFTDGWAPGATAVQQYMQLIHPQAVIAANKHSYIRLWAPGTHTKGDGWLYQNRAYGDLFVVKENIAGIYIVASAA